MPVLLIALILFAGFLAVILIRTLLFVPEKRQESAPEPVEIDCDRAVNALVRLIRCRTVSRYDSALEDDAEFEKLYALLPELYPRVSEICELIRLPDRGLLYRWKGKSAENPSVMMAHYDVVPADESGWDKSPFDGIIEDGVLWGRGALDTKVTFNGVLSAAEHLIEEGFVPENDIYFAFSGGEEVNGMGAVHIVNRFTELGIRPALVLDEGGAVVENVFPGVKKPCGLIGIGEKGYLNCTFTVKSMGGHASAPAPHTPVGILAKACCDVENHPFPMHLTKPAAAMFDTLGRHSTFLYRMIFANLWLFSGVLNLLAKKSGGEMNALLRTTAAFTQAAGSTAPNVIPPEASMTANLRLNPADSVEGALGYLRKTVNNEAVTLTAANAMEPSPVSRTDCEGWDRVASAVADTWRGCIVSPYLMVQCSDSRHYRDLSDKVYRFSAMALTKEERASIHGHNEKIRVENVGKTVEFYVRLMKQC